MVYAPSFLYFVVSTVMPASRARSCEYCEAATTAAAGLGAAAVVGAVVGAGGAAVAAGLGAAVGAGAAGGADEQALTSSVPEASRPVQRRTRACGRMCSALPSLAFKVPSVVARALAMEEAW